MRKSDKEKNERIKQTLAETRQKRLGQTCRVYTVKIQSNKLNAVQKEFLKMVFVEAKWLYNHALSLSDNGTDIFSLKYNSIDTVKHVNRDKDVVEDKLRYLSSQMKQEVLKRIIFNIRSLAKRKDKDKKVGKLKYLSQYAAIDLIQSDKTYKVMDKNHIRIQGLRKPLKVNGLEQILRLKDCEMANAKLISKVSGYYVAITVFTPKEPRKENKEKIGVDFGCKTSFTLSDGRKFNILIEEHEHLKSLQRRLSRSKKGSNNRWKLRLLIRKEYEKIMNRKDDVANKLCHLLDDYQVITQDDQIKTWTVKHGKKVAHDILGRVKHRLYLKDDTVFLSKCAPTTKLCPKCGNKHDGLVLKDRVFKCPICGYSMDRDVHAARNMIWFYENIVGAERTELTLVDIEGSIKTHFDRLKQEAIE